MHADNIREKLSRVLDAWDYDFSRFEISGFIAWVESRRGRPILVSPMLLPPNLFGAWIEGDKADHIFYEAEPPEVHTVHNILHELSHILLGHRTVHISGDLSQHLSAATGSAQSEYQPALSGLFRAVRYTDEQEIEAETLSSLIQQKVFHQAGITALSQVTQGSAMQQFMRGIGMDSSE